MALTDQGVNCAGFGSERWEVDLRVYAISGGSVIEGAARLQQRVFFKLSRDEGVDFEIGEGQQFDRLLKLRRHNQRLALPQVETRPERHQPNPLLSC